MSDDLKGAIVTTLVIEMISIVGVIITNVSMKKISRSNQSATR